MLDKIEVVHIVATDLKGCIGNNGDLPWHLPADLKRFKELTSGGVVVMGRKTFESLNCKPLPNRVNIVITNDFQIKVDHASSKAIFYSSIIAAIEKAKYEAMVLGLKEVWIIGGQTIYGQTMPYVDRIENTLIHGRYYGDAFYKLPTNIEGICSSTLQIDYRTGLTYQYNSYKVIESMQSQKPLEETQQPARIKIPVGTVCLDGINTSGRKHDSNKPRYSLLPSGTVNQVIQVLEYGASDKYEVDNWQKIPDARRRFYDAAMRHIDAWWNGEINDLDKDGVKGSQLPHLAHAICCLLFLLWFDDQE